MKNNKRVVSFPHMGNIHIPVSCILKSLNAEIIIPPANNKHSLSLGVKYSNETVCLPYKLNLGNYIQALEMGANTLLMFQAPGTCRLGNYALNAEAQLKELGYEFDMIIFNLYKGKSTEIIKKFSQAAGTKVNLVTAIGGVKLALEKFNALDTIEKKLFYIRPREIIKGSAEIIYEKGLKQIDAANNSKELSTILNNLLDKFQAIKIDKYKEILKVFITGEFFILLDPFTNMSIEKALGEMGVQVERQVMLSDWTNNILIPKFINKKESHKDRSVRYAKKYLKRIIGGDSIESIGDSVYASHSNIDGVIHLGPFNCIPEVVAQSILPNVSKNENIPVISLSLDEQTGKAGYITRLEAFVDLIKRRKSTKMASLV